MISKGLFVTFEGGDGAGKTTLMELIARQLNSRGHQVIKTREPGGTLLGEEIRTLLLRKKEALSPYTELSLFLAARAQHIFEVIRPAMAAKKIVLCDRFNDSSIAYQGIARGLGKKEVAHYCGFMTEEMTPDVTFFLDLDPSIASSRSRTRFHDRIESEGQAFQEKVREAYLVLAKEHPSRIRRLDATLSPHALAQASMEWIEEKFDV